MIQKRPTKTGDPRYAVRIRTGTDDQGRPEFRFRTFPTKGEAQKWEREQLRALDRGEYFEPSQEAFGRYVDTWLASAASMRVRPRTLSCYRRVINCYLRKSEVATVPLARLTTAALERHYAALSARGLAPRTVRLTHSLLRTALAKAERDRLIAKNPASGATLPRQTRVEMHALDAAQVMKLLATAEATKNRWTALWAVLATGGLRPSEALALRWEDVLFTSGRVRVRGAMVTDNGGWSITECKTAKSRRMVPLPPRTMEALRWQQTQQAIEREAAGAAYHDWGLVFTSLTGGPCEFKNAVARWFHPLVKAAGLPPIRAYDLRHSFASNALAAGVSVLVVSELLGHASAKMTLDVYGHVLAGEREGAAAKLAAYFEAASER